MPKAVLPLFYAPPLPFFVAVYGMEEWHLDAKEHFVKATYRNRASIAGPNGALSFEYSFGRWARTNGLPQTVAPFKMR